MLYLETVSPTRDQPLSLASNLRALTQKPMQEQARWENQGSGAAPPDALPNSEFRRTETFAWRSASVANQRSRKRLQLCKRCAASARRRSSSGSRLVAQPPEIVAEVQAVHSRNFIASIRFDNRTRPIRDKL